MSPQVPDDDRELSLSIRRASGGNASDLAALVDAFTPLLLVQAEYRVGAALRRFVEPADVVNDVWLVALRRLPDFRPEPGRATSGLVRFLGTVMLHHVRDLYEKHIAGKPQAKVAIAGPASSVGGVELSAETTGIVTKAARAERHSTLQNAIAQLDPVDRAVVVLRAIEDQPNQVVAGATGLAPNTVSVRLRRAIEKLRKLLPESLARELDERLDVDAPGATPT